ncbi:BET1-like protein isoform X2 [Oncorhynchus mykiss]|uniref:BET1-like protein isoform X2 n=1 Tax=Oncorhynchus mykiss TaxID=8022 RepID=UPI001878683F|nr:BET1-like protein isoform X2 [Oncorhynchus mykiss]
MYLVCIAIIFPPQSLHPNSAVVSTGFRKFADTSTAKMADWNRGQGAVDDMLDAENKLMADNLASKVSRLKSDSNFLSATGLLTGSVKRFSGMVRSGRDNRKILCYVSVGLVFVFFLLYYLIYRVQN